MSKFKTNQKLRFAAVLFFLIGCFGYISSAQSATSSPGSSVGSYDNQIVNGKPSLVWRESSDSADKDNDGLSDELEIALGTDPNNPDSDADGYKDGGEVANGYNPLKGDRDQSLSRRVEVNLSTQKLDYYLGGVKIASVPVSTGVLKYATPKGDFKILRKRPVVRYTGIGYDFPNTKWNLEFKKSFYLHGAYWHNQFGKKPMSHGCVNIGYKDAEKLYAFMRVGDEVKIYGVTPHTALAVKKQ